MNLDQKHRLTQLLRHQNQGLHQTASMFFDSMIEHSRPHWAQQQEREVAERQIAQEYAATKKTTDLLTDAYEKEVQKTKEAHSVRFKLDQDDHMSEAPPESQVDLQQTRKPQPKPTAAPASQAELTSGK